MILNTWKLEKEKKCDHIIQEITLISPNTISYTSLQKFQIKVLPCLHIYIYKNTHTTTFWQKLNPNWKKSTMTKLPHSWWWYCCSSILMTNQGKQHSLIITRGVTLYSLNKWDTVPAVVFFDYTFQINLSTSDYHSGKSFFICSKSFYGKSDNFLEVFLRSS